MSDFWRFVLERLLGWPVVILVLALVFYRPIRSLMTRLVSFKGVGIEVAAPMESASKQLEADKEPKKSLLTTQTPNEPEVPVEEDLRKRREAVLSLGLNNEVVRLQMMEIENQLSALQFPLEGAETSKILVRQLAATQIEYQSEKLFRLIFGSQIALLQTLNDVGTQSAESVRRAFEAARFKEPSFYAEFTLEQWLSLLISQQAVALVDGKYGISYFGQEFLVWMIRNSVGSKPH